MKRAARHHHPARGPKPGAMPRWQARLVYGSVALLFFSGLLWLLFHYGLPVQTEFGPQPHPLEYQWLRLHGAAAMLSLIAVGSMLPTHIVAAWTARRNRASGLWMGGWFALLALTGYLLYYFVGESSRPWISAIHWLIGLAAPAFIFVHRWNGQRRGMHLATVRPNHHHPEPTRT